VAYVVINSTINLLLGEHQDFFIDQIFNLNIDKPKKLNNMIKSLK
jgi:hypothetical protein